MPDKEEQYAGELYRTLRKAFAPGRAGFLSWPGLRRQTVQQIGVAIEGAGVHWHCTAAKETRSCHIHCFDIDLTNFAYKGPEYYSEFKTSGQTQATGRTFNQQETVAAAGSWLRGGPLQEVYREFAFVDVEKRKLQALMTELLVLYPGLREIQQCEIVEDYFLSPTLCLQQADRGCSVECADYDHHLQYSFTWDDSALFEAAEADVAQMGALVNRWVVDAAVPSVLAASFPAIDFGQLAEYYERGAGIEGEFMLSWDALEAFYQRISLEIQEDVLRLIKHMRARGFDKKLRAGQSLYSLILSRSRRHGLRMEQPALVFTFGANEFNSSASAMHVEYEGADFYSDKIEYTASLENLLERLQRQAIS